MDKKNQYYIRINEDNQIIKVLSSAFESPLETDILVCENNSPHFNVSSELLSDELKKYANIENGLPLADEATGLHNLKYENGIIRKLTDEELQEEIDNLPQPQPSELEQLKSENEALKQEVSELNQQVTDTMLAVAEIYESTL